MGDAAVIPFSQPGKSGKTSDPLLREVVGEVLRRTRQDQDRTLADVASQAQVSMPYLSEIERGRKEPSSEVVAAICRALGIDLLNLLTRTEYELARRFEPARRPGPVEHSSHRPGDVTLLLAA